MRLFLLVVALYACLPAPAPPESAEESAPWVKLYGVKVVSYRGGQVAAVGHASELAYLRLTSEFSARDARMRFPPRQEVAHRSALEVSAPLAQGAMPSKRVELSGGVVARSGAGMVGATERALIEGAQGLVSGKDRATVSGPGYALEAGGFFLDLPKERYLFEPSVSSRLGGER
ncbi:MAG: hypothetical protein HYZ28_06075 [Myxococcales bacterium]|nr:hypothetical protein [Myxococcales bacterium]